MTLPTDPPESAFASDASVIDFAHSEVFERTYREGMTLVEEMAAYLDGPGRAAARTLPRMAALAYAGETMRLTTRLMQVASWLMVQRAVREGEITPSAAREDKYRLAHRSGPKPETFSAIADLPDALQSMSKRADALFDRVVRLDAGMHREQDEQALEPTLHGQMARLRAAFGEGG